MGKVKSKIVQVLGSTQHKQTRPAIWQIDYQPIYNKVKAIHFIEYKVEGQLTYHQQIEILIERTNPEQLRFLDFNIARLSFATTGMLIQTLSGRFQNKKKEIVAGELSLIPEGIQQTVFNRLGLIVTQYQTKTYNLITISCKTFVDYVRKMIIQFQVSINETQKDDIILWKELKNEADKPRKVYVAGLQPI